MDFGTYIVLIVLNLTLDGFSVFFRASLFSDIAGIVGLSGTAFLVNDASLTTQITYSGGFITRNAPAHDYTVYLTLLIIFTVVSFLLTIGIRRSREQG